MQSLRLHPKFLRRALERIGLAAVAEDLRVELAVCHRACFVTAFMRHGRPQPFAVPNGRALSLVEGAGEALRFRAGWLDDDLAAWLRTLAVEGILVRESRETGVALSVNEGARILAHKLAVLAQGARPGDSDAEDARRLLRCMRGLNGEQVEALYRRHCPELEWSEAARQLLETGCDGAVAVGESEISPR